MAVTTQRAGSVPAWLCLAPGVTLSLPLLMYVWGGLLGVLAPGASRAGVASAELFVLAVLLAPPVGLFVLAYLGALLWMRKASPRDRGTVGAAALGALCVAQPVALLALMLLTHGLTR